MKKKIISLILCTLVFLIPLTSINAYTPTDFLLHSEAIKVISLDTGQVMYEKNIDEKKYPASLTKLLTAYVVVNQVEDINTKVIVQKSSIDKIAGTDSSLAGVQPGEEYSVKDLLYMLLMVSGNDVAEVLADYVSNNNDAYFIELMNTTAKELGMANSHFTNPHGLPDTEHYSTANDLEKLTMACLEKPVLNEILFSNQRSYIIPENATHEEKLLVSTNFLLDKNTSHYYKYAKGIKTGHTDDAGRCLISTASKNGYTYLIILLKAPTEYENISQMYDYVDTINLYDWLFDDFEYKEILSAETPITEIKLNLSRGNEYLQLFPKEPISAIVPKAADKSTLEFKVMLNIAGMDASQIQTEGIDAPIIKGQVFGEVEVIYGGEVIGKTQLVSGTDVDSTALLYVADFFNGAIHQLWFQLIAIILMLMLIVYITGNRYYAKKKNAPSINYKNYRHK